MTIHERAPLSEEESEQQDEEAVERFDDESVAVEPGSDAVGRDPDGTRE